MMLPYILKDNSLSNFAQNPCQVRCKPMAPCSKWNDTVEKLEVGSLYEIDHSKLPPRCPGLLQQSIRVVMVAASTELNVTVRYPSLQSLKRFFGNRDWTENLHPAMDDKFVMGPQVAKRVLFRRIPFREFSDNKHSKAFWLVRFLGSESITLPVSMCNPHEGFDPRKGTCLLKLQGSKVKSWGKQRAVTYVHSDGGQGNSPKLSGLLGNAGWNENGVDYRDMSSDKATNLIESPAGVSKNRNSSCFPACVENREEINNDDGEENNPKYTDLMGSAGWKGNRVHNQDANSNKEMSLVEPPSGGSKNSDTLCFSTHVDDRKPETDPVPRVLDDNEGEVIKNRYEMCYTRNSKKRKRASPGHVKQETNFKVETAVKQEIKQELGYGTTKGCTFKRWSAHRYMKGERVLVELLKKRGAVNGNPVSRSELRELARKQIGDTGLLDHLLKHMVGRVVAGEDLRFQRRCKDEGKMEYWLENASFAQIRKEAGVKDSFWFPPQGWKPGDPLCALDCRYAAEARQLKKELASMESEMQKLVNEKREHILETVQGLGNSNLQLARAKEVYNELLERKADTERRLQEISEALEKMKVLVEKQKLSQKGKRLKSKIDP